MSLVGFKAQNHEQQVSSRGALDAVDDRETDPAVFASLEARFGPYTLDAAAAPHNAKCARYFTAADDGLAQSWAGEGVWCNPPFSECGAWVAKAWAEAHHARGITMLLPANRTEQPWWQQMVEPFRDRPDSALRVAFLPGRLRFVYPGEDGIRPNGRPPFGCCVLIWSPDHPAFWPDLTALNLEQYATRAIPDAQPDLFEEPAS